MDECHGDEDAVVPAYIIESASGALDHYRDICGGFNVPLFPSNLLSKPPSLSALSTNPATSALPGASYFNLYASGGNPP